MSDDLRNLYGVNLSVAILTRFPLLDEVHYRKEDDRIGIAMDFRLQLVPEEAFFAFKEELTEILLAFTQLEEEKKFHVDCEFKPLADDWWQTFLFIPAKEIRIPLLNMLVQWFQDFFHDGILPKEKSVLLLNEDERNYQEDLIENMLQVLRSEKPATSLRGIREEQQIIVFKTSPNK